MGFSNKDDLGSFFCNVACEIPDVNSSIKSCLKKFTMRIAQTFNSYRQFRLDRVDNCL